MLIAPGDTNVGFGPRKRNNKPKIRDRKNTAAHTRSAFRGRRLAVEAAFRRSAAAGVWRWGPVPLLPPGHVLAQQAHGCVRAFEAGVHRCRAVAAPNRSSVDWGWQVGGALHLARRLTLATLWLFDTPGLDLDRNGLRLRLRERGKLAKSDFESGRARLLEGRRRVPPRRPRQV